MVYADARFNHVIDSGELLNYSIKAYARFNHVFFTGQSEMLPMMLTDRSEQAVPFENGRTEIISRKIAKL